MSRPPPGPGEEQRLATLRSLGILDTGPDVRYDRITRLALRLFDVPIALVTFVDEKRQWFKSHPGLSLAETSREIAFCAHTIAATDLLIVPDTREDPRFADNPLVTAEPHIRFYAGCPFIAPDGSRVGSLAILDRRPRNLSDLEMQLLRDLGAVVESEIGALYMTILDHLPIGVYRTTPAGRILDANAALVSMLGYPDRESFVATSVADLYADPDERARLDAKAEREGGLYGVETQVRRRDGRLLWVRLSLSLAREAGGRPLFFAGTLEDVTERRQAEAALWESEERYRALYEKERAGREQAERLRTATLALGSTLDLGEVLALILRELQGVVPYDTASIQEYRDEGMEVIAGFGFPDLAGILGMRFDVRVAANPNREVFLTRRPVVLANAPAAYPEFVSGAHASIPTKSWIGIPLLFGDRLIGMLAVDKYESGFYTAEHVHLAESFASPAAIAMENARLYAAAKDELAERKRVEDQFRQSQKMEAVGRLAGGIAHDFNNLLGVILGYTELAGNRLEKGHPAQAKLDQVRKAAERAAALTGQLLAFSRKQVLVPEVLDLSDVITDLSAMLNRVIGEDVRLETVVHDRLGVVRADRGQIGQALLNLAVNARDAMPRGGTLTIEVANVDLANDEVSRQPGFRAGPHVMLAVSDTGIGMSPDVVGQIFEPFFTTKEQGKGTGLGLSMVYGFLQQSGGHVSVYSELGRGTTFKLYLPRLGEDLRASPAPAARAAPGGGSETVLVVEDAGSLREMIMEILVSSGYRVLDADTAERALQIAQAHEEPIDLVLTDMVMPGMSGAGLAEALHGLRPEVKILFMSGYTDDVMVQRGVLSEQGALIQKPFTSDALLRKIREALARDR